MFSIQSGGVRLCDGLSRRDFVRVGGLGSLGLALPELLRARSPQAGKGFPSSGRSFGRAKHCILLYMWGGPPHQDTFDLKPDAPAEVRGEFMPIPTNVPGMFVSDHLPLLSRHADKYLAVRSVSHKNGDHISQCHDMLTGNEYTGDKAFVNASPSDNPHIGAVLAHLQPRHNGLPAYVQLPCQLRSNSGKIIPGQNGGFLGSRFDPILIDAVPNKGANEDPGFTQFTLPTVHLPADVPRGRLLDRGHLLRAVDRQARAADHKLSQGGFDSYHQQAFSMVTSARARHAFNLAAEDAASRDRYGRHGFGQGVLMARRLVEAGVPLVTVYWPNGPPRTDIGWDNHINNFQNLKNWQLPPVDQALSALLDDLAATGRLDETLVVWMGEFGRSPSINENGGRDHWPYVFSVVLAGGGVRGGQVYGSSDRQAAYPLEFPVTPHELGATIYHFLGVDVKSVLHDQLGRPHLVCPATPVAALI